MIHNLFCIYFFALSFSSFRYTCFKFMWIFYFTSSSSSKAVANDIYDTVGEYKNIMMSILMNTLDRNTKQK